MQLSEADRLSFAFLAEAKQSGENLISCAIFLLRFFLKKMKRETLIKLRVEKIIIYFNICIAKCNFATREIGFNTEFVALTYRLQIFFLLLGCA